MHLVILGYSLCGKYPVVDFSPVSCSGNLM